MECDLQSFENVRSAAAKLKDAKGWVVKGGEGWGGGVGGWGGRKVTHQAPDEWSFLCITDIQTMMALAQKKNKNKRYHPLPAVRSSV